MTIDTVFDAIASERSYQVRRWGRRQLNGCFEETQHSVGEFLVYMQDYLTEAFRTATREDGDKKALEVLRKVVTLGVACFEQHGVPFRQFDSVINGRDGLPA